MNKIVEYLYEQAKRMQRVHTIQNFVCAEEQLQLGTLVWNELHKNKIRSCEGNYRWQILYWSNITQKYTRDGMKNENWQIIRELVAVKLTELVMPTWLLFMFASLANDYLL